MPRAPDLRQLRYFVAVAESGSFRAAAERLHVSQPPLSRQVAALERSLGARLLERRASGCVPTAAGRVVLARAGDILRRVEALAAEVSALPGAAGAPVRIGLTAALTVKERAALARAFRAALRGEAVEVAPGFSRDLLPALKEGRLDFALVGLPGNAAGLEVREVAASPLVAALPARHRLARRRSVSLLEVTDLPLFWIPRSHNPAYHDFCLAYFRRIGYRPETIVVEPGQLQTLERIAQGEGWTIPNGASVQTRVRGVAYRGLAEGGDLAVRVAAAWRPGPREAAFESLARRAASLLGPGRRR